MGQKFQAPKGVAEYTPPDSTEFLAVRDALAGAAQRAGYVYLELPIFEDTGLYVRGVGESTDVVSKEMYTFDDRGGRSLTLRPEGTAGVVRSVIEHNLDRSGLPVKLWYAGPFFRAERPQRGRYRQFNQVGLEALGSDDPALDAEVIAVAVEGFASLGLTGFRLLLNSLGDSDSRMEYREVLTAFLSTLELDEATQLRAQQNPLRVLDDKRASVQAQLVDAPLMVDVLSEQSREHHDAVREYLRELEIVWEDAPRLVRGLDYYTRTTFEFVHDGLGAQSAIGGGGRYDGLMANLGGRGFPDNGFGLGVDRTLLACRAEGVDVGRESHCDVFLVPIGDLAKTRLMTAAAGLRAAGIRTDFAFDDRSLKGSMRAADRSGAKLVAIVGDAEVDSDTVNLKNLATSDQVSVPTGDLVQQVQEMLNT